MDYVLWSYLLSSESKWFESTIGWIKVDFSQILHNKIYRWLNDLLSRGFNGLGFFGIHLVLRVNGSSLH